MAPGPKKIVSVASWQHLAIAHALGDVLGHLVMQSIYLQLFHVGLARGQTSFMDVTSKSQWWYTHDLSECWTLTLQASFHFFFPLISVSPLQLFLRRKGKSSLTSLTNMRFHGIPRSLRGSPGSLCPADLAKCHRQGVVLETAHIQTPIEEAGKKSGWNSLLPLYCCD